ncbi:MAG TPA: shikimate kinase [bacterium]|jgi:shikimate kinase|nr:shikimate kinase [bacterium]
MKFPPVIVLVGFMGSGKTSTGKELAKALHFDFLDTDHWIEEKNKKTIAQIFEQDGEAFFRSEEKKALDWIRGQQKIVVSTGGGLWINEENRARLLSLGWCVWLRVSAHMAWKRVEPNAGQRPLLEKMVNPLDDLGRMIEKRNPIYELAHSSFYTDGKNAKQVSSEIVEVLKTDHLMDLG